MNQQEKKIILSGIQPSGIITIGNYFGAVKNWVALQNDENSQYECYYMVVDLHALTVRQDAAKLRAQTLSAYTQLAACGLDPERTLIFIQSHVSAHAELAWVLGCFTQFGELSRMTQFKDKSLKNADNINSGLFTYPVLMAADILLYQAHYVPIGADQKQHLELARDIAIRFNNAYTPTFRVPEPMVGDVGARIMSLTNPTSKMSKSDSNPNSYVSLSDDKDTVIRKFKRAVTDSFGEIHNWDQPGREGIANLMSIYACASGKSFDQIEREFDGRGYAEFKTAVGETVADALEPVQRRFAELSADKAYIERAYTQNAYKARAISAKTLDKVYRKIGLVKSPK